MSEITTKRVCCTCLATDRNLNLLCRVPDGINLLYTLLIHDSEAYKEGFYKDTASLLVCWECDAMMHKIKRFQKQACLAQKRLSFIADGRTDIKIQPFSRLATTHNAPIHYELQPSDVIAENFVDCGPLKEIKEESDSDDVPLSVLLYENDSDNAELGYDKVEIENDKVKLGNDKVELGHDKAEHGNDKMELRNDKAELGNDIVEASYIAIEPLKLVQNSKKKTKMKYNKYFSVITLNEEEMLKSVEKRKINGIESVLKCEYCKMEFQNENELIDHHSIVHSKTENVSKCNVCYIYTEDLPTHIQTHYQCYSCILCTHTANTHMDIVGHLKNTHKDVCCGKKLESKRKSTLRSEVLRNYACPECDLLFQNKDLRWKHVQKAHKEGYKCSLCGKKFAFKNNLERHERIHQGPLPREECPICHKMIRVDLVKVHSRIHTDRTKYMCVECDKSFVSRETYESHLKYTQKHATVEVCRHKCPSCHKRYRSRGELNDHINYQHKGQAEHKCPVCGKGLATKRCIRRHVRRAHEGIKESAKDKICQQCGKAFRDKKGLIEHERVHSGARPLSCARCGRGFRQRAALYAHTRRMHAVHDDNT